MSAQDIADKLWNLCNVLRDDGVTYHQYLNELTYILFLRMSEIRDFEEEIPKEYRWNKLKDIKDNKELFDTYSELLATISNKSKNVTIKEIYTNASTTLRKPANLKTLITSINDIDWQDEQEQDKIATIYEELLEKNAGEKKSGAGQYFTPRPLINIMVELLAPKLGEYWNDPACGTFGFMISVDQYLKDKFDYVFSSSKIERNFQQSKALSGCELVQDAHRLALMNAKLHGLDSTIIMGDTLSEIGKKFRGYNGVLANPPFGTKKGGERPSRDDFTYPTSNKQLNFLQHIYRSLHKKGGARAGVIMPDNVLFEDGDGQKIRQDLMDKCNLHTILRLPTGIFYAQGVKTNVLFFERGKSEKGHTKKVWFYDMRTGVDSYGKRTPFNRAAFEGFVTAYTGGVSVTNVRKKYNGTIDNKKREKIKDERWTSFTREEIAKKRDSLDIGLHVRNSSKDSYHDKEPLDLAKEAAKELTAIQFELNKIIGLLNE
jgi:type I restriction enzyme M protein